VTSYRRGLYREKETAARLGGDGYFVMESRGSHGPCDLLAVKIGQVLALQVKAGEADLAHEWVNELYRLSMACGMIPLVADWPKRCTWPGRRSGRWRRSPPTRPRCLMRTGRRRDAAYRRAVLQDGAELDR